MYSRLLQDHIPNSQVEIMDILHSAPPSWMNILGVEHINRVGALMAQAILHQKALTTMADSFSSMSVTLESLSGLLKGLGLTFKGPGNASVTTTTSSFRRFCNYALTASANVAQGPTQEEENPACPEERWIEEIRASKPVITQAYNTEARRQRPPPPGGYCFSKANHVVSSTGPPPSPCKHCGSTKHWDRECLHKPKWNAK